MTPLIEIAWYTAYCIYSTPVECYLQWMKIFYLNRGGLVIFRIWWDDIRYGNTHYDVNNYIGILIVLSLHQFLIIFRMVVVWRLRLQYFVIEVFKDTVSIHFLGSLLVSISSMFMIQNLLFLRHMICLLICKSTSVY